MSNSYPLSQVFQHIKSPSILMLPDVPKFTIVAVNDAYLKTVNTAEKDLIGKGIFEAFPENMEDRESNGVENLRKSLNLVIAKKDSDTISFQKYKLPIPKTSKFKAKYANVQNIPIKDDDNNIDYILHSIEDVTDKKNLEIAFEIERQRFNDLYFQAPSCMGILKGPDHVYELANPLYLELIGVKDVIGKTVKDVLPELEAQGILGILDTVYETGKTFSASEMLVKFDHHQNGELVDTYLNFNYQANRNEEGIINGILFFASDVTELVLARQKTEESEKRYKELIENLPVATYSCDAEGHILIYNKAAAALWGREPEIGVDKWGGSFKIYSETGEPLPHDMCPMVIGIKEGGKISDQEIIIERPNGEKLNVLSHPVPFKDSSGRATGVVNVLINITKHKKSKEILTESEKKYRQIVETAQEGIWVLDEDNKTTFVNNKLCEILGYTQDEMMGKDIYFFMDEAGKQKAFLQMQKKKEGDTDQIEFKYISKCGKVVWTHISSNPLFDETGIYKGGLAMVTDITERRSTDEKLRKLNKELDFQIGEKEKHANELLFVNKELAYQNEEKEIRADELILANHELEFQNGEKENRAVELSLSNKALVKTNEELDRFVYSVSHDLRSPLTSILGLISFIEEESREPMIRASINRLDGFIKNILNYSQNNRTGVEPVKIPIKKTIHEIVDSVSNIKEAKGISFLVDIDEQQPFYSDWQRFYTILKNLISNAIKYHTDEVTGRYLKLIGTSDNEVLKLSISDNGIGIEAAYHNKIFDMFYRLPSTTTGSGFGLYIVKETLEKLHGTIEIQSEKGVGTTFIITLKNLKE